MPWKECNIVEERLRFIARLLDGEKMAGLCREFSNEFDLLCLDASAEFNGLSGCSSGH